MYLGNIKRFIIYVRHKKQLENVYLGNMKKFIIYVGHKKQLENVYLGNMKKFNSLGGAQETAGECVPGEHENFEN